MCHIWIFASINEKRKFSINIDFNYLLEFTFLGFTWTNHITTIDWSIHLLPFFSSYLQFNSLKWSRQRRHCTLWWNTPVEVWFLPASTYTHASYMYTYSNAQCWRALLKSSKLHYCVNLEKSKYYFCFLSLIFCMYHQALISFYMNNHTCLQSLFVLKRKIACVQLSHQSDSALNAAAQALL